jgi:hypothetical protein
MRRVTGRVTAPSGNSCFVDMFRDDFGGDLGLVLWDKEPPTREDLRFYERTVVPIFSVKGFVFLEVTTR